MIHWLTTANGPSLIICIMVSFAFYAVKNVHHLYLTSQQYKNAKVTGNYLRKISHEYRI